MEREKEMTAIKEADNSTPASTPHYYLYSSKPDNIYHLCIRTAR
jgi:hypothetical protein